MRALLLFWLIAAVPASGQPSKQNGLLGHWVSMTRPGPGEAPAIWPSLSIELSDTTWKVRFKGEARPYEGTAYALADGGDLVTVDIAGGARGDKHVILRPLNARDLRVEVFTRYPVQTHKANFYYVEVFRKAQ
jgi:hypothetical protein